MALDLDSMIGYSDGDDDGEDEDLASAPHRTLDDILNDSDSSSSSSSSFPSRGPLSHHQGHVLPRSGSGGDVAALVSDSETVETLNSDKSATPTTEDDVSGRQMSSAPLNRVRLGESSAAAAGGLFSLGRRISGGGPMPPLFGSVRLSSSKPGAALAAAAAASRSVPTPHAAAIKLRRAGSSNLQKVLLSEESRASASDGSELGPSIDASSSLINGDHVTEGNERMGTAQPGDVGRVAEVDIDGALLRGVDPEDSEGVQAAGEHEFRADDSDKVMPSSRIVLERQSSVNVEKDSNGVLDSAVSPSGAVEDEHVHCPSPDKDVFNMTGGNSSSLEFVDSAQWGSTSLHSSGEYISVVEGSAVANQGIEDWEKVMPVSNDGEVGLVGNEESPGSVVTERVEDILERVDNKRMEKELRPPMKPLEAAEELEKKQASTGLHWEEGAAAQPMRLEGVRRGSTVLGYFDIDGDNTFSRTISSQVFRRDHGSPQVVAVHANFIAMGMSKGSVVIAPSRYSPHNADSMDAKILILGSQGDRSHTSVTSICFNQQGDLLLAGYGDGHITLWDVQRTTAAKVITGEHSAPVVHTFFLVQDSQVTRQFKAVTGDSKGLVLLHAFSVLPLLNMYSITTQCIVDGQRTGMVLAASPLLSGEFRAMDVVPPQANNVISSSSLGVVIFVTHQTALVIRLTPTFEVYAQLPKPEGVREGSMPYTAWKCMVQSRGSSTENTSAEALEEVSLLAIAWDRKVQVAKLVKSELKIYGKWTLESAAIGAAWLNDQMLVVLTSTGQLCLYAKDGSVVHKTSISRDGPGGDDLIVYHTHFINIFGNPEKAYHNSVAVRGASIYIIGPSHLIVSRLLPWKERIQVLRRAGDWMGALSMAMTIFDGEALGVIDLPKTLHVVQEAIIPDLLELLFTYVDEVFSYISVAFCIQLGKMEQLEELQIGNSAVFSEIKEQFTRVGGVAVEFCVHIKKTNILFDEIFPKFEAVRQRDTFLELLEPYILKDMLGSLPPEIMQALVEHYSNKGWLHRVEQCVLHMDIASLDFNQVVKLCREHGLYGALIYLFNRGLDDFKAPLEELLIILRNSNRGTAAPIGYRMLVYLKYCFSGRAFPPGHGTLPPVRLPSLRAELVQFLLEDSNIKTAQPSSRLSTMEGGANLYYLLELDTEATLDVLGSAFGEGELSEPGHSLHNSDENIEMDTENDSSYRNKNSMVQNTVDVLVCILDEVMSQGEIFSAAESVASAKTWPSKKDIAHVFDFIAYYITCERAQVSKSILSRILEYLTSESGQTTEISKKREKQVLALLEVVPRTDWNESHVLQLCEKAKLYQVCALIYSSRLQYLAALDSYMKDTDEPIHAFSFINTKLVQLNHSECVTFRSAVISRIPELVNLSREATFFMVIDHFNKESPQILAELQGHPKSLFFYLKTVIEAHLFGTLNFSCIRKGDAVDLPNGRRKDQINGCRAYLERISDFPKLLRNNPTNINDEMIELYIELLCQYERTSVLKFLQTFENYRVEHCLRLCQEYGIIDAAAFLLERVGDVGSALSLTLSGLNDNFIRLDAAVESVASEVGLRGHPGMKHFSSISRIKEVSAIHDILNACIGLCQRNSRRLQPEESEFLWFRLLESFCVPLTNSNYENVPEGGNDAGMLPQSLGLSRLEDKEVGIVKWRISRSHRGAQFLKRLFSQFVKEIVEGMMGYIHLPTIMSKLLSENTDQEFGNFKLTILGMLATCGFEKRILDTAKSLIEDDAFYTMSLLKKGASHGYAPRVLLCCICGCLLIKNSSSYSIRVFGCGHSTHLHCEAEINETSRTSSPRCPVCVPSKKRLRSRSKSILEGKGLVNMDLSRSEHVQGAVLHSYESESQENPNVHQQISRFDILNNLQKEQHLIQLDNMPQLRLSPPAVYHEKVKKGYNILIGESSHVPEAVEKLGRSRRFRDPKTRGSSIRFPLKSSIFGREKGIKR